MSSRDYCVDGLHVMHSDLYPIRFCFASNLQRDGYRKQHSKQQSVDDALKLYSEGNVHEQLLFN